MNAENLIVLTNIIGAVESGGQIYGRRNYAAYTGPRAAIPGEKTITLGWAQNYGYEARRLVKKILESDPETFRSNYRIYAYGNEKEELYDTPDGCPGAEG